jgi:hypothetical protein
MSNLFTLQKNIEKMAEKVQSLSQRVENRNLVEKIARKLADFVDVATFGGPKAFVTRFLIPSNVGQKTLNSLDLERQLSKNLRNLDKALDGSDDDIIDFFINLGKKVDIEESEDILPKAKAGGGVPAAGGVDDLVTRAKQFDTAEEFIKNQDLVYHGSSEALEKFDDRGAFFTDDIMNAEGYGGGENLYEGYLDMKNPLIIDAKGRHHADLKTEFGSSTQEIVGTVDSTKYDGVIFKNINDSFADDVDAVGSDTILYPFNANKSFINESQLTDIWKQAQ